jgi:c-di-GMP-binding flagellar brake protein YcgR
MQTKIQAQPDTLFPQKSPRRHVRALYSVPVTFHYLMPGGVRRSRGITLDISEAGLGALVQGDLRVGETVEIDLPLSEHTLSAVAIVRHTSRVRCGFEFLGLTAEERQQITAAANRC